MPALATLPSPPASVLLPEPVPAAWTFPARSFSDYVGSFGLDPTALRGKDVLDVAAGASSFAAEAWGRKIHAVAVDPRYDCSAAELTGRLQRDHELSLVRARLTARRSGSRRPDPDHDVASRERSAAERFLADYETHFVDNRYVAGALPQLPFLDGTFDLVLCGGLLFAEPGGVDPDWNLAACREMVRVSAGLIRIFPVCDACGRAFPGLARLRRELKDLGIGSSLRPTLEAGNAAGTSLLELRRATP